MRRTWIALATTVAAIAALGGIATAAPTPQPTGPATSSWSVTGKAPKGSGADTDQAEACVGKFGAILREFNGSNYYIHFGATQQCTPYPAEQDLQVFLYRWRAADGWIFVDSAHAASPAAILISAWDEPPCTTTASTTYRMMAWGHALGVQVNPYPATSITYTINCYFIGW